MDPIISSSKKRSWFLRSFFLGVILATFLAPGHAEAAKQGGRQDWKRLGEKHASLHRHIKDNIKPNWTYQLDLTDGRQYAYVLHMLELAGENPEKSPELYRRLKTANAKGGKAQRGKAPMLDVAATTSNAGALVPLNLLQSFYRVPGTNTYSASALSSYPNGSQYTKIAINLTYQKAGSQVIFASKAANTTQFAQGENFWVDVSGGLPADAQSKNVTANMLVLASPGDGSCSNTGGMCAFVEQRQLVSLPVNGCMQKPIYKQNQGNNPPLCTNNLPNVGTENLVMCYYRGTGNSGDCDYWSSTPHPPQYAFPIKGTATFMSSVNSVQSLTVTLQRTQGGGGCMLCASQSPGQCPNNSGNINPNSVTISGNTLSWDWSNAGFPNTSDCVIQAGGDYTWFDMEMFVEMSTGEFTSVQFASEHTGMLNAPQFPMPQVEIMDGCLAKGTQITLRDGTEAPIEDFKGGNTEYVRSGRDGKSRGVLGNTRGTERIPIVYIEDKAGRRLLLTEGHPVVTAKGVIVAKDLKVGDEVITASGPSALVRVGREQYDGEVRNLKLDGSDSEALDGETTMFANGILVGDAQMQKQMKRAALKKRSDRTAAEMMRDIPAEWHDDYMNHMQPRRQ
ncbi:MAG TPA: Hint domain-containing protein [Gallionella sp.]|nr:Hint domain-containing protein [Gallionella sp.]